MTAQPDQTPDAATGMPFGELPSPLDSVADLRTAAKWTIAAAGAVGAALIGGAPLVAAGQVHGVGRAVLVGAALVVALAGVGLAIWQTSQVLVPPITTQATLREPGLKKLRDMIDASPADFFGVLATSVDDLLHYRAVAANLGIALRAAPDPARRAQIEPLYRQVLTDAGRVEPYVGWLLATAHVWQVRAKLRRAQWSLLGGVVLVAVGAATFLAVTGQQNGPDYVPVVTTRPTVAPAAASSAPVGGLWLIRPGRGASRPRRRAARRLVRADWGPGARPAAASPGNRG